MPRRRARRSDEKDRAVGVIEHGEIGREQEADVGDAELIGVVVGHSLPRAHRVVGEIAHEAAGERRQSGQGCGPQQVDGVPQGVDGAGTLRNP
jgi:hypothetical protein